MGQGRGVGGLPVCKDREAHAVCAVQSVERLLRQDIDLGQRMRGKPGKDVCGANGADIDKIGGP
jgi:hypothetical protein